MGLLTSECSTSELEELVEEMEKHCAGLVQELEKSIELVAPKTQELQNKAQTIMDEAEQTGRLLSWLNDE
jgi:regulator of sirC expression with transglutaminase-like and TPR domain